MKRNYGIAFCNKGIRILEDEEDRLFKTTGEGFAYQSEQAIQLSYYRKLLVRFQAEKDSGRPPSYNPDIHGTFGE